MKVQFYWPQEWRDKFKEKVCSQCNRTYGSHSMQEFEDCMDKTILAPDGRTWKEVLNDSGGRLAKTRDDVASNACSLCSRAFREHSDEEFATRREQIRQRAEAIRKTRDPRPE